MKISSTHRLIALAALSLAASVAAQVAAPPPAKDDSPGATYVLAPHSDSRFAATLLRLNQADLFPALQAAAVGTPAEKLWQAQDIVARWPTLSKNTSDAAAAVPKYVAAVSAYLDSQSSGIDGVWALDHAEFIFGQLSEATIDRIEFWGPTSKDRAALTPLAQLADRLMKQAVISLDAGVRDSQKGSFDEALYQRSFAGAASAEYYNTWDAYFLSLAEPAGAPGRNERLLAAAKTLGKWADATEDTGVNFQSLLLRGKVLLEAGDFAGAVKSLTAAETAKAPDWVRFQAQYQMVVAELRAGDFAAAHKALDAFAAYLPPNDNDSKVPLRIITYRLAWAEAQTKQGAARDDLETAALDNLSQLLHTNAAYRDLVYRELADQAADAPAGKTPHTLQRLAAAYTASVDQKGDTPESKQKLTEAAEAAATVFDDAAAAPADREEAAFLAAVCRSLLGQTQEAIRYEVSFAEMAPASDSRVRQIVDLALQQLATLHKPGDAGLTPELRDLSERALALSTEKLNDPRWRFTQGRTLEEDGKLDEAARAYAQVPESDSNYLEAQFDLVSISTRRLTAASTQPDKLPPEEAKREAEKLFAQCDAFIALLDHPPASVPPAALARAKAYVPDIWLIETGVALGPAVHDPKAALAFLEKIEAIPNLSDVQHTAVLRYRIEAYQLSGQMDKAFEAVQAYAAAAGQSAQDVIKAMTVSTMQQITAVEKSDPAQARHLADYVAKLLDPLIAQATKDHDADGAFEFRQIKADMLIRSGNPQAGRDLAVTLENERPKDLRSFMTDARACFALAQNSKDPKDYAYARDYFKRILPQITPGVDSYWECWLRIFQANSAIDAAAAAPEIKQRLQDLHVAFGAKFGGVQFHDDFQALLQTYLPGATTAPQ